MGTRVRTSPQRNPMGSSWNAPQDWLRQQPTTPAAGSGGSKPQIFVRFEFGVSWTPGQQPSNHSYTYMSRGLRGQQQQPELTPRPVQQQHHQNIQPSHFTRHVPPPTTNYLAPEPTSDPSYMPQQSSEASHQHRGFAKAGNGNTDRLGRAHERSSQYHERGSSAPPPFSDSPWDSNTVPGPSSQPVQPRHQASSRPLPQIWKDLPPRPGQKNRSGGFLGVEAPWEGGGVVEAFGEYHPDHDQTIAPAPTPHRQCRGQDPEHREQVPVPFANNPTTVPIDSRTVPTRAVRRGEDPARVRELEALGSAMMTVDNGFENQWWYQGERENMQHLCFSAVGAAYNRNSYLSDSGMGCYNPAAAGPGDDGGVDGMCADRSAVTTSTVPPAYDGHVMPAGHGASPDGYYGPTEQIYSLAPAQPNRTETYPERAGLAAPTPDTSYLRMSSRARNESLVVSPMTEAGTPYYTSLSRSLTTRSEELHF